MSLPHEIARIQKALVAVAGAVTVVTALYLDQETAAAVAAFVDSFLVWLTPNAADPAPPTPA